MCVGGGSIFKLSLVYKTLLIVSGNSFWILREGMVWLTSPYLWTHVIKHTSGGEGGGGVGEIGGHVSVRCSQTLMQLVFKVWNRINNYPGLFHYTFLVLYSEIRNTQEWFLVAWSLIAANSVIIAILQQFLKCECHANYSTERKPSFIVTRIENEWKYRR